MPPDTSETVIRRRTDSERLAYLEGWEAGMRAVLCEVRRLNFSDVAARAETGLGPITDVVRQSIEMSEDRDA